MTDANRLKYLKIIESEDILNNRYKSIKRMGANGGNGAFSLMFTADDINTGNKVALKFFDPSKFNESDRYKRFEREAEMFVVRGQEQYGLGNVLRETHSAERDLVGKGLSLGERCLVGLEKFGRVEALAPGGAEAG